MLLSMELRRRKSISCAKLAGAEYRKVNDIVTQVLQALNIADSHSD